MLQVLYVQVLDGAKFHYLNDGSRVFEYKGFYLQTPHADGAFQAVEGVEFNSVEDAIEFITWE